MIDTSTITVVPETGAIATSGLRFSDAQRMTHLANLLALRHDAPAWLQPLRDQASAIVQELAIPSTRDENWRFTDLTKLLSHDWQRPDPAQALEACDHLVIPEAPTKLVFLNAQFQAALSHVTDLPKDVVVGNLSQLNPSQIAQVQTQLAQQPGAEEVFTALNTASLTDIAIVWVPRHVAIAAPIHLVFLSRTGGQATFSQPRCLVIAESGSQISLVEEYASADIHAPYFTNAVTEIFVGDNAHVSHTRLQWESTTAFHIGKTAVSQGRDSRYACYGINFGATLARHNLEVHQLGAQADTQLYGLGLVDGDRTSDTHSLIAFSQPHGTANQLHKYIADEKGHGVFNGRIYVPKLAQETNAAQLSRNLLLSSKARIDTKPELEIIADSVKCAHGATVSQLEDDEIFYLQSRGIDANSARKLLKFAFAVEVINQIPVASLRQLLTATMRARSA
jgi:Fe-S cluster assembly protein SufD